MNSLDKLIYVNESVEHSVCDTILNMFNDKCNNYLSQINNDRQHKKTITLEISTKVTDNNELNHITSILIDEIKKHVLLYFDKIKNEEFFEEIINKKKTINNFIIKKFLKNKVNNIYEFNYDIDIYNKKSKILNFVWYLNDDGEIEILGNYRMKPKKGSILIFPSEWFFPYCNISLGASEPVIIYGSIYIDI